MPLNRTRMEDAWMLGRNKQAKFLDKWKGQWNEPMLENDIAMFWQQLPDEIKLWYRTNKPQAYAEMEKRYGGGE